MKQKASLTKARLKHAPRWIFNILGAVALGGVLVSISHARERPEKAFPGTLVLEDGKVTAQLNAVSLHHVLQELGRLSGAQIRWLGPADESTVSVDFADLSLPEALRRLLGGKNFMLFYTSEGEELQLTRIWVSSPRLIGQPLLSARSTDFAPPDLIQTALSGPNDNARIRAIWQLRRYATKDPRVKSILLQITQSAATSSRLHDTAFHILSRLR